MLIIFGGLPGTGKTTIAKLLSVKLNALYLRIDTIEQALIEQGIDKNTMDAKGYEVAYAVASGNLTLGLSVIADSVNPIKITRDAWRNIGHINKVPLLEIEIICSNKAIHRHRVENRIADIVNHQLPSWQAVVEREYDVWPEKNLVIDTASLAAVDAVNIILNYISVSFKHL